MKGITNAPQGSGGGSGGEWIMRANNNNWTDLFQVNADNTFTSLKDILLIGGTPNDPPGTMSIFIPKGLTAPSWGLVFPWSGVKKTYNDNSITITQYATLTASYVSSSYNYITTTGKKISFSVDFAAQTFGMTETSISIALQKNTFTIYTRD